MELLANVVLDKPPALRRRMNTVDRQKQIIDGAIQFFARYGMDGQLRNLT